MKTLIKLALLLTIVAVCLFEFVLDRQSGVFRELELALLQTQWMLMVCVAVWCGTLLFLTFSLKDLPLIGLLIIAIVAYCISRAEDRPATDAVTLLFGVTLGKGMRFALQSGKWKAESGNSPVLDTRHSTLDTFLFGLVLLLAFASWWHLDMTDNFYHGPRWMGLWNNPNDYGLLMSAGFVLSVGLLAARERKEHKDCEKRKAEGRKRKLETKWNPLRSLRSFAAIDFLLLIAAGMLGMGLLFSYSRGSWFGATVGLLYLAKAHGKFKWRSLKVFLFSGFCFLLLIFGVWFFWNNTPDSAPWFVKRLDLSRGSAQHRIAAWRAGFEIMRDHPLGVGWNKAVGVYQKNYSPPEGGAAAITTNDYLMLGTQLGLPGLVCFLAYVALCFRGRARHSVRAANDANGGQGTARPTLDSRPWTLDPRLRTACRAGALTMLVAFWFDYGLFKLATAAVFWILLELGTENRMLKAENRKAEINLSLN